MCLRHVACASLCDRQAHRVPVPLRQRLAQARNVDDHCSGWRCAAIRLRDRQRDQAPSGHCRSRHLPQTPSSQCVACARPIVIQSIQHSGRISKRFSRRSTCQSVSLLRMVSANLAPLYGRPKREGSIKPDTTPAIVFVTTPLWWQSGQGMP